MRGGVEAKKNYNIRFEYGMYQNWKKYEKDIISLFKFKSDIVNAGNKIWDSLYLPVDKTYISIHFRLTDYLLISSLNLSEKYYVKALQQFNLEKSVFLIFSDDIEQCKDFLIFEGLDVRYMERNSAGIDMYLMSLCHHNIIANSSFSFWGAMLNMNPDKRVICPYYFFGKDSKGADLNGKYYPDDWIVLDET